MTPTPTTIWMASFDRCGRSGPQSTTAVGNDPDDIARQLWHFAKTKMASREVYVEVDLEECTGVVLAGGRPAGHITLVPEGN